MLLLFVFLGPTRWTGVRSVTRLAGWIRARIVGPLNTLGGTNGRPRERGCKTDDNCFLLIDEFQSGPCALTRLTVSLHAYTSNCRATSRGERTRCCTAHFVFTSAKTRRFGPLLRFNYARRVSVCNISASGRPA